MSDLIQKTDHGHGIVGLTLNRPQTYNALSRELMRALVDALKKLSSSARVVILKGAGKGFSAGHDLKEIAAHPDREFYSGLMQDCCELMQTLQSIPQPVIAQIHGVATAAGCQLVAACDLAVAAQGARFATPGVLIGLFCTTPMVEITRNLPRKKAFELLLTGEMINANDALSFGLINRVVEDSTLESAVLELALKIASQSAYTISLGKRAFYTQNEMSKTEAYAYAAQTMVENLLAPDAVEGISAFLEKRKPVWKS